MTFQVHMMPGQDSYSPAELRQLYAMVEEAAYGDPGEQDEPSVTCRCCGKPLYFWLNPIHTQCIPKHWGKHAHGINASRCKEFGKGAQRE